MLHLDVEPRVGYLYVTASGALDVAGAEAALAGMFAAAAQARQSRILLDCSRLAGTWGPDERYVIGSFIAAEMERRASQSASGRGSRSTRSHRSWTRIATRRLSPPTAEPRCAPRIACRSSSPGWACSPI